MDIASATDAVDAVFDALGAPAVYTGPDGAAITCQAVVWTPKDTRRGGGTTIGGFELADRRSFVLVRRSQVADPLTRARFVITFDDGSTETWETGEDAPVAHDSRGLAWRCGAQKIG
jgi:hypothetical protein